MIVLILSLMLSFVVLCFFWLTLGFITGILPALLVLVAVYLISARQIAIKIQKQILEAVTEIQKNRTGMGIDLLKNIKKKYAIWQFFLSNTIDGQIGIIYFMSKDLQKAQSFLEKSLIKQWNAQAMLGIIAFKKKEYKKMDRIFEKTTKYSPKQGLLWSTWAYCHWKIGNIEKAIEVLSNGQKKLGNSDKYLISNLMNLKNSKKIKMAGYGQEWLQFQLEQPQQVRFINR